MAQCQSRVCHGIKLTGRRQERIEKVLENLNLSDKYPEKLSRDDLYQITNASLSDDLPTNQRDLAYHFLRRIMRYDYSARDSLCLSTVRLSASTTTSANTSTPLSQRIKQKRLQSREVDAIAPLDILIAVFLCCDHICRQDLVSHLCRCRLAFPFFIQENPSDFPNCFVWPLRSISLRWETSSDTQEGLLIRVPLHFIAFIRVGDVRLSKSNLINDVISDSQKDIPVFFHRDSPGSITTRYLVDGYVDACYYVPDGESDDAFSDAIMVLNVHGDATQLEKHCEIISEICSIITVISTIQYLRNNRPVIEKFLNNGKSVFIILNDSELYDSDYEHIDSYTHLVKPEKMFDILPVLGKNRAKLITETRTILQAMMKQKDSLENIIPHLTNVKLDEGSEIFKETKERINIIIGLLKKTKSERRKHAFLPLQMGPMKKWAIADKELVRASCTRQGEDLEAYKTKIMTEKKTHLIDAKQIIRSTQMNLISLFLSGIKSSCSSSMHLFIRLLKIELDDLSRREINPTYKKYQRLIKSLAGCDEISREEINGQLEELDEHILLYAFGLEHILREIGYLYMATSLEDDSQYSDLPDLAVEILLHGYPFEIMDGDVKFVPVTWVKTVFERLRQRVLHNSSRSDVHLGVLSTLGIQSSGKSTMLNVLFGCQFAVSAGRCTRGVYGQLIKADVMSESGLPLDYILALDTEGLRAPELSSKGQMITHDNELSTFVIGLGNKTMITLMGENTTHLEELLPISVHAFLRMEEATGLHPSCLIVHHNVDKKDQDKLLQQKRSLENVLDKFTCVASRIQGINLKHFKEVIDFNIDSDVYYIPALLEGSKGTAPISRRYSEELSVLRKILVTHECVKTRTTLSAFIDHLDRMWLAIERDDFVYQFRHMIDIEARGIFDDFWCDTHWKFRNSIQNQLSKTFAQIQNCRSKCETEKEVSRLKKSTIDAIQEQYDYHLENFSHFIKSVDTLYFEPMKSWKYDITKRLDDLRDDLEREWFKRLDNLKQDKESEMSVKEQESKYREDMVNCIKHFVKSKKPSQGFSTELKDNLDHLFQEMWEKMVDKIVKENPRNSTPINFSSEISIVILTAVPKGRKYLNNLSGKKNLTKYDFHDFNPSEMHEGMFSKLVDISSVSEIRTLSSKIFQDVIAAMRSKQKYSRPYDRVDLMDVVIIVKDGVTKWSNEIKVSPKTEVNLAVSACGYAAKILNQAHKEYEDGHHPRTVMENEKNHYKRIFMALFTEVESVNLISIDCVEILQRGITERLTRELPEKILMDIKRGPYGSLFTLRSHLLLNLLAEMAEESSFDRFLTFILTPGESIKKWMSDYVENYNDVTKNAEALNQMYTETLSTIGKEVESALRENYPANCDLISFLRNFSAKLQGVIVHEDLFRFAFENSEGINLDYFIQLVSSSLTDQQKKMEDDKTHFLKENFSRFRDEVVERNFKSVIGCTETCPFCGAICMVAHKGHAGYHRTTLHRPKGVKGVHMFQNKMLSTTACSEAVKSDDMTFCFHGKEFEPREFILYKEYKKMFPQWEITPDVTGDETSFWYWFFAQYATQLAEYYKSFVPEIPKSWKQLDCKTEMQKLKGRKGI